MDCIYCLTMRVMKKDLAFYVSKYPIKNITSLNYVIDGRRIKRDQLDIIEGTNTYNVTNRIAFQIWTVQKDKIKEYKKLLQQRINDEIKRFSKEIQELSEATNYEPKLRVSDYTKAIEIPDESEIEF